MYPFKNKVQETVVKPVKNATVMSCLAMVLAAISLLIAVFK